jgi:hypothetical protein
MNLGSALKSACIAITLGGCALRDAPPIVPTVTLGPRATRSAASPTPPTVTPAAAPAVSTAVVTAPDDAGALAACSALKPALTRITPKLGGDGRVVLLTADGNAALSSIEGAREAITTDATIDRENNRVRVYQFPAASGDGSALALIRIDIDSGKTQQSVEVFETHANPRRTEVFSTSVFNIPYVDWAPDGRTLAFLTISQQAGAIRTVASAGGAVQSVESGLPTYWHWRADSSALLTHLGGRAVDAADAHVSLVAMDGAATSVITRLDQAPGQFQSPHFSPDGAHMLFVRAGAPDMLVLADAAGAPMCVAAELTAGAFFAWSPDGVHVAMMDTASPLQSPAPVRVIDLRDGSSIRVSDDALSFYWSPDGERLAVYSISRATKPTQLAAAAAKLARAAQPQASTPLLALDIVSRDGKRTLNVVNLIPTQDIAGYFAFFDQYSRAVTPWSPNGKHIAFAGFSAQDLDSVVGIATIDATANSVTLKPLGAGTLAFFIAK